VTELLYRQASELCRIAIGAASVGAIELLERSQNSLLVDTKGDRNNLVTDADFASEALIRKWLSSVAPNDAVTGEELPGSPGRDSFIRWSIDPLDGTTNYTRGLNLYCTSVGAWSAESGSWLAGAVVAPAMGVTYFASRGRGAWVVRGSQEPEQLTGPKSENSNKLLGTGFSYSPGKRSAQLQTLPKLMESFDDLRRLGSAALSLCLVAEGSLDAFYETDLQEHDWAAAALIAEEAGLVVIRPSADGEITSAYGRAT
jgi:myo-inositol-1(or 4)-monophosphatase